MEWLAEIGDAAFWTIIGIVIIAVFSLFAVVLQKIGFGLPKEDPRN